MRIRSLPLRAGSLGRAALTACCVSALVGACSSPPASAPSASVTPQNSEPAASAQSSLSALSPTPAQTPLASGSTAGRIVFVRFDPAAHHDSLFSVNPDGSDLHSLMTAYPIGFAVPRWSWQGDLVAAQNAGACSLCNEDRGFETIVKTLAGSHLHLHLPSNAIRVSCAAWSPDARLLACEGWSPTKSGREGLYTVSVSSDAKLTQITTAPGGFHDVPGDYGTDGRIAFVRTSYAVLGLGQIWIADADGSNAHKITDTLTTYRISWSRDERWIVGTRDGVLEVFDMQNLGVDPRRIEIPDGKATEPRWSPDASRIVFAFRKDGATTTEIESIAADGTGLLQITSGNVDSSPDWGAPGF